MGGFSEGWGTRSFLFHDSKSSRNERVRDITLTRRPKLTVYKSSKPNNFNCDFAKVNFIQFWIWYFFLKAETYREPYVNVKTKIWNWNFEIFYFFWKFSKSKKMIFRNLDFLLVECLQHGRAITINPTCLNKMLLVCRL